MDLSIIGNSRGLSIEGLFVVPQAFYGDGSVLKCLVFYAPPTYWTGFAALGGK